jgi:cytochrome c oxidase subunit I+III
MPRRIYTYLPETGWGSLNLLVSAGAGIITVSVVLFVINVVRTLLRGAPAPDNPWGAPTLEWATPSPPEPWNFANIPVCESRTPLWGAEGVLATELPVATGLKTDRRELLVTTALDAVPDCCHKHPGESIWPLAMAVALGVTFIGAIFSPWFYVVGFGLATIAFAGWALPRKTEHADEAVLPTKGIRELER